MPKLININGTWTNVLRVLININGTWTSVSRAMINVAGTWRQYFSSSALSLSASNVTATNATFTISSFGYSSFKLSISPAAFAQQDLGPSTTYTTTALSPNTIYTATAQAWTGVFYSGLTTTASTVFTTTPATPSLTVTSVTATSVTVSWSAISGATAYYASTNGSTYTSVGNVTSYEFTGLTAGTTYTFYIKAYRSSTGLYSTAGTVTGTPLAAPGTPTQSATSTDTSITINWAAGTGTTGSYKLNVWSSLSPLTNVASSPYSYTTSTTSLTISSGLSRNTPYYYQILAYAGSGQTGPFTYASPDTNTIYTKLQAPVLTQGTGTATQSQVQWTAVTGATSYEYSTDGINWSSPTTTTTSHTFTGLSAGNSYFVYIRGKNANTVGMPGSTTIYTAPSAFTSSSVGSITQTGATISWVGPANANSYRLSVFEGLFHISGSPFSFNSTTTSKALTGLTASTTYTYGINAYTTTNQFGPSSFSSGSFTTLAPALTVPSGGSASIALSSGTAGRVGAVYAVTKTDATGNPSPGSPTYQWQRSTSTPGSWNATGGTSSTYTAAYADVSLQLRCVVTWTNSQGSQIINTNAVTINPPTVTGVVSRYYTNTAQPPGFAQWTITGYNFQAISSKTIVNGTTQAGTTVSGATNNNPSSGITRFTATGSSNSSYALIFRPEATSGGGGALGVTSTTNIIFNSTTTRANNPHTNTFSTGGSV